MAEIGLDVAFSTGPDPSSSVRIRTTEIYKNAVSEYLSVLDYEYLETETDDRTLTITLDNEESLNALNISLREELEDALLTAEDDDEIRAVVLTGAGRAFSSGYDFGEEGIETMDDLIKSSYTHLDTIFNLNLPVIAAVDGYALAGGCNLALVCDLTIATERSEFGFPDVHMGELPPRLILPFVTDSLKQARELLYGGKHIDADTAAKMGLVNRVVEDEDALEAAVEEEVSHIKKTPSSVVKLLKDTLNDIQETQGYRSNSAGQIDEYLFAVTSETETAHRFHEIVDEEGVSAAIEWMNTTEKD
ncbi:enoyl-CoA hydratase/isomerase family protein [Natribaculum luteum]|uniref:Enoyl-CoA hydratase/isomerase family protein n=1 Tax=Natribaculum luteum TaxID=1586232 RepID=A0ABD5NV51_9EURY|nr:enoyl-CoA hydratase/isomerase family protein [Natribaculum luteum]